MSRGREDAHPCPEILALPLLHRSLLLEGGKILEVEPFVFAVELRSTLFTALDDLFDVVVYQQSVQASIQCPP